MRERPLALSQPDSIALVLLKRFRVWQTCLQQSRERLKEREMHQATLQLTKRHFAAAFHTFGLSQKTRAFVPKLRAAKHKGRGRPHARRTEA